MASNSNYTQLPSPEVNIFLEFLTYLLIYWTVPLIFSSNVDRSIARDPTNKLKLPYYFVLKCIAICIDLFLIPIYYYGFWYSVAFWVPCGVFESRRASAQEENTKPIHIQDVDIHTDRITLANTSIDTKPFFFNHLAPSDAPAIESQRASAQEKNTKPTKPEQARPYTIRIISLLPQRSFVQQRLFDIKRYFTSDTKLQSSYLEHDELGWIVPKAVLNQNLDIAELKGFVIDWSAEDCPSIKLYYKPAENGNGLLSVNDIDTMLQLDPQELRQIYFSLNCVNELIDHNTNRLFWNQLDTVYEKVCTPKKLANTGVMETLFYADYIMKFLAVGSEVSANFPFDVRPVSHLIQHLPKELQHSLRSVYLRELQNIQCICPHRFWIEVKQLDFQSCISDAKEYFYISSVETKVNTESLGPHPTRSGCKSFADDLTRHYSEVSRYLRIFARLPELAKLQFILIKVNEQLTAKGYSLSSTDTQLREFQAKCDFVPSSCDTLLPIIGGVQMAPTYNKFPFTPEVDDSAPYEFEQTRMYGLSSFTQLAQTAREGGIRLQPHGVPDPQSDGSMLPSLFDVGNGLLSLELAMIASVLVQRSTKKTD